MEDHARILEQRIQAAAVGGHGRLHDEGIAPGGQDQTKKGHDTIKEHPEPEARGGRQAGIGAGEGEQAAHDAHGKRPEQHGAGLSGPEGRQTVEGGQEEIRIARHVLQAEILPEQGMKQQGRSQQQRAAYQPVQALHKFQRMAATFIQLENGQTAAREGAEQQH